MLEEIPAAGDQVALLPAGAFHDPLQGGPQVLPPALPRRSEEPLTGKGSIKMQVSEVKKAKGH